MLSVIGVFDLMYATTTVAGRVLPPDGGLLRGARGLPDPDARGEPPARGLWQKARRRGSCHAAQLQLGSRRGESSWQIPPLPAPRPPFRPMSRSSASRACARASVRSRCSRASTCPLTPARSSPLSAPRARASRLSCAASTCSRLRTRAISGSTARTSRPSAVTSTSCARTSAWCFRALTCSTTWTCSTTARSRPSRSKR